MKKIQRQKKTTNPLPDRELAKPILPGTAPTDYERYLRTEELLSLQKKVQELRHPDEMTFQVVHQSTEIMLKGALHELERARVCITRAEFNEACHLMRRAGMLIDPTISLLHVLETLTPYDYHVIRAGLGHGSGLDSPGFLGLLHMGPRLGDAFFGQLGKALISPEEMYRRYREFPGLHDTAECLLDFDERVQLFRYHHLKLAERIIGGGVIGTSGVMVEILHQRLSHSFYKPLWEVRNEITNRVNLQAQKPGSKRP